MPSSTTLLYLCVALIWGSTWLTITFQLGVVDPLVSVIYRFALAALVLFGWCRVKGITLRMSAREHRFLLLQGSLLFGLNYWVLYQATGYLTSGLIAATFATIVFFNALCARLFLAMPLRKPILLGGVIGLAGVALLFTREIAAFDPSDTATIGLGLALLATVMASLGNIAAAYNTGAGRPIIAINAWAMLYGTLSLVPLALLLGVEFTIDWRPSYLGSLLYLAVMGSVVTFNGYLTLIHRLGPDKAAYMSLLVPVIALSLSSLFEGYHWTLAGAAGLVLILLGNWVAMRRRH